MISTDHSTEVMASSGSVVEEAATRVFSCNSDDQGQGNTGKLKSAKQNAQRKAVIKKNRTKESAANLAEYRAVELLVIRELVKFLTGHATDVVSIDDMSLHNTVDPNACFKEGGQSSPKVMAVPSSVQKPVNMQQPAAQGVGRTTTFGDAEKVTVEGKMKTRDDQHIDFSVQVLISNQFKEKYGLRLNAKQALRHPAPIQLSGAVEQVGQWHFHFELDSDDITDTVTVVHSKRLFWLINHLSVQCPGGQVSTNHKGGNNRHSESKKGFTGFLASLKQWMCGFGAGKPVQESSVIAEHLDDE